MTCGDRVSEPHRGLHLGVVTQPVGVQYCILTSQLGFGPGNVVSFIIYLTALRRARTSGQVNTWRNRDCS